MKTLDFEWKILEWFDRFESDLLNRCNQYISLILGSIGLIVILMIVYWTLNKEKGLIIAYNLFLAMLVNNLLKGLIMRKRPFENAGYEHLRKLDVAKDGACWLRSDCFFKTWLTRPRARGTAVLSLFRFSVPARPEGVGDRHYGGEHGVQDEAVRGNGVG